MFYHIIIILIPLFLGVGIRNKKLFAFLMFTVIAVFVGLRSIYVGADTLNYKFNFEQIYNMSLLSYWKVRKTEILYLVFTKVIATLSKGDFRCFLIVSASVFAYALSLSISKISSRQGLSWFFFISFSNLVYGLSGIRSSFGLAFGLLGITYLIASEHSETENKTKYLVLTLIAIMFHYSAIVYLAFLPLIKLKKKKPKLYCFSICFVALVFGSIGNRIVFYLANVFFPTKEYEFTSSGGWGLLLLAVILLIYLKKVTISDCRDDKFDYLVVALELTIVLQILALQFGLMSRVAQYIFVIVLILLPDCLELSNFTYSTKKIVNSVICIAFMLFYIHSLIVDSSLIVPYAFMWE